MRVAAILHRPAAASAVHGGLDFHPSRSRKITVAELMCVNNTRVDWHPRYGLSVKHEEECCPMGPHFSKTRGVYAHIAKRNEGMIGCLDTTHSQGGWATAQACRLLGKSSVVYWPRRKAEDATLVREPQRRAAEAGAALVAFPATTSWYLYHQAKKSLAAQCLLDHGSVNGSYMMPNALKLPEMIDETAAEVRRTVTIQDVETILVSASSGTIAAGVIAGVREWSRPPLVLVHQGYSRPPEAIMRYMKEMSGGFGSVSVRLVDECYKYADEARPGELPPWPCNKYYDLKAFRWWLSKGRAIFGHALLWNIG